MLVFLRLRVIAPKHSVISVTHRFKCSTCRTNFPWPMLLCLFYEMCCSLVPTGSTAIIFPVHVLVSFESIRAVFRGDETEDQSRKQSSDAFIWWFICVDKSKAFSEMQHRFLHHPWGFRVPYDLLLMCVFCVWLVDICCWNAGSEMDTPLSGSVMGRNPIRLFLSCT